MDDAMFADLTGISAAPKPMRAMAQASNRATPSPTASSGPTNGRSNTPSPAQPVPPASFLAAKQMQQAQQAALHSAHGMDGLDDLSTVDGKASANGSAQPADTSDAFAMFGDLALGDDAAAFQVQEAPQASDHGELIGFSSDEMQLGARAAAQPARPTPSVQRPARAAKPPSAPAKAPRPPSASAKASAAARPQASQAAASPQSAREDSDAAPSYDDIMGSTGARASTAAAAPARANIGRPRPSPAPRGNDSDSDSSMDTPQVPSVFIYIGKSDTPINCAPPGSRRACSAAVPQQPPQSRARGRVAAQRPAPRNAPASAPKPATKSRAGTAQVTTASTERKGTDAATLISVEDAKPVHAATRIAADADMLSGGDTSISGQPAADTASHSPSPDADLLGGDDADAHAAQQSRDGFANVDELDDFFQAGSPPQPSAATAQAGGSARAAHSSRAAAGKAKSHAAGAAADADLIAGMGAEHAEADQEPGDVALEREIAAAREACTSLPPARAASVHEAVANAHAYVQTRMAEKRCQANVTKAGLHYARLSASKTAASVLARSVAYQVHEARQEADVAEAGEYKDEIKASIKAWAFQGGQRRGLRNLLVDLNKVLWDGAKWECKTLADVSTDAELKKWLRKARLLLHTDKMAGQPERTRLRAELILIELDKALKGEC